MREGAQQRQDSKIQTELISGPKSQGGLDAKTYWLTDRQSWGDLRPQIKRYTYVAETSVSTTPRTSADANSEQDLQGSSATSKAAQTDCITSVNKVVQQLLSRIIVRL
jgi:hypothetical protein